jgi:hypothetical protein
VTRAIYSLTIWIDTDTKPRYNDRGHVISGVPSARHAYIIFGLDREATREHARRKVEAMRKVGLRARDIDYDLEKSRRWFPRYTEMVERPTPCTEHFDRHWGPMLDTGAIGEIATNEPNWWTTCTRECCKREKAE